MNKIYKYKIIIQKKYLTALYVITTLLIIAKIYSFISLIITIKDLAIYGPTLPSQYNSSEINNLIIYATSNIFITFALTVTLILYFKKNFIISNKKIKVITGIFSSKKDIIVNINDIIGIKTNKRDFIAIFDNKKGSNEPKIYVQLKTKDLKEVLKIIKEISPFLYIQEMEID